MRPEPHPTRTSIQAQCSPTFWRERSSTQLEGEQPITYAKGQSWYESPKKPHVVSRNASVTEPAKLLVLLLSQEGEALKVPVKAPDSGK